MARSRLFRLDGLQAPVEIRFDEWGIPHIEARTLLDLFFAQGFVHGRDRGWQMRFNRLVALGRLSEVFGPMGLEMDRFARGIGWAEHARAGLQRLPADPRRLLEAYAAGVTAAFRGGPAGPEDRLIPLPDFPWAPEHSAAWGLMIAWSLSWNWDSELCRVAMARALGERAADLEPEAIFGETALFPETMGIEPMAERLLGMYAALARWLGPREGIGSNNWVVAGSRTATGFPILANDPHLPLSLPSIWYEQHLVCEPEGFAVAGVTAPGLPGVVLGHNHAIAWGATAVIADTQDWFIERFDPEDPLRYETPDGWARVEVREIEIRVRGKRAPERFCVRVTRHGPVLTDGLPEYEPGGIPWPQLGLALAWAGAQAETWLEAILRLNRAHDWESFREALRYWPGPVLNFVYADREGHIGYQMAGRIPIRRRGHGLVPVPGWSGEYDWIGEIPFEALPSVFDPPEGMLVTANHRIVGSRYPYFISAEWMPDHRARRIRERLESTPRLTAADCLTIQADVVSLAAREWKPWLAQVEPADEEEAWLLAQVRAWDGRMDPGGVAPTIVAAVEWMLLRQLLKPRLGSTWRRYLGEPLNAFLPGQSFYRTAPHALREILRRGDPFWLGERPAVAWVSEAFREAVRWLRGRLGKNPARWTWGRVHRVTLRHVLGQAPVLAPFFNRGPFPLGGDGDTPLQAGFQGNQFGGPLGALPSWRFVADLQDWDRCLAVLPGGQGGSPASPYYFDQFALWHEGRARPMFWRRETVRAHTCRMWRMEPPGSGRIRK
ncbi:penicillin acylase family protein [Thermoflexus sp.]|uniref:penicillin acylase family protein n=1 Tax=Thermoflexus sp. TaxID=1969742 RepID=UPI00175C14C9|nr:penicillin acylase family protein [Thermoflexus sp.]